MKKLFTILVLLATITAFGQKMTSDEWNEQAKDNIRLLPKYGHVPKTDEQKRADKEFIETTLKKISSFYSLSLGRARIGRSQIIPMVGQSPVAR